MKQEESYKSPLEQIQEIDYQISQLNREVIEHYKQAHTKENKITQLQERKASLLNYLNHDSVNQDKTE